MTVARTFLTTAAAAALLAGTVLVGSSAAHADDVTPADAPTVAASTEAQPDATPSEVPTDAAAPAAKSAVAPRAVTVFGTLKASPAGPYTDGQSVTLTYDGFPANAQIVASTCVGGIPLGGPGDCAPLNGSGSAITAADASGKGTVKIKVIKGTLGASDEPTHKCGNSASEKCVFSVTDFSGNGPKTIAVTYASAATPTSTATKSSAATSTTSGTSGSTSGTSSTGTTATTGSTTTSTDPALATTGSSTGTFALAGLGLVALGALFMIAFSRRFTSGGTQA